MRNASAVSVVAALVLVLGCGTTEEGETPGELKQEVQGFIQCAVDCDCPLDWYCSQGGTCAEYINPGPFNPNAPPVCNCDSQCGANTYCQPYTSSASTGACRPEPTVDVIDRAADGTACGDMGVAHPSPAYLFRSTITGRPGAPVRKFNRHASCNGTWWEDTSLAGQTIGPNGTLVIDYSHASAFTCAEVNGMMGAWESYVLVGTQFSPVRSFVYLNSPCGGALATCGSAYGYCPPTGACNSPGCH